MRFTGALLAYFLIKRLIKPWTKWDAYKAGLIDNKGNTIKKASTREERKAFTTVDILVRNIKRLLEKLPFGKSKLASIAAALYLIKEEYNIVEDTTFDREICKHINILNKKDLILEIVSEDKILEIGKYVDNDHNMYIIKENFNPFTVSFGVPLYRLQDIVNKEDHVLAKKMLRKV